jgi:ribonuclease HI
MSRQMQDSRKNVSIYTDGGCLGNPGPGGYGVVLRCGEHEKRLSGGFRQTTNNRMEITAAIAGLEALKGPCSVTLYSDSKYLVDAMRLGWVQRWKANGWRRNKKDQAVNVDLWERLLEVGRRHTVSFVWIEGHAGHQWNEACDALSKQAASGRDLPVDEGYEQQSAASISSPDLL